MVNRPVSATETEGGPREAVAVETRPFPVAVAPRREASELAGQAYARLRNAIAEVVLQPGQSLSEASLAEWLGIGRTPIREALLRLRDEGLVEVIPRKGYVVSRISVADVEEIYELLEALEAMAVKLAAQRASAADLARLEETVRRQEAALAADDLGAWIVADADFHNAILDIAANRRIRRIVDPLNAQLHRLRVLTIRLRPKPTRSTEEHRAVLAAVQAGDDELAFRLHRAHRAAARLILMDAIRTIAGPHGGL